MAEIAHPDGRVELDEDGLRAIEASALYNDDLAPVPLGKRTWSTYNFAALWISMAHCIPTYMLASGLIGAGMSWGQALFTIALGNVIVLVPILANSHAGTKYGIPFPVFARAAYGTVGSNLPALMRAIVACGWFGINCWIGGQAIHTLVRALVPEWHTLLGGVIGGVPAKTLGLGHGLVSVAGYTPTEYISFALFWALNVLVAFKGMDLLRKIENWAAPFVLVMTALLVGWAIWKADGLGPIMTQPAKFKTVGELLPVFIPSLTAMIGFWATLSLNMPDFTRFGRSQREQAIGQMVALPSTMTVFAAMGVVITSATAIIFGRAIWDPVELVGQFKQPWVVAMSMFTVGVATISVNIAANVVSPANDFANAFPRFVDFKRGGLITGILGVVLQPWRLIADPSGYIYAWLLGYSGGLGSIAGVLIVDYYALRGRRLALADLYLPDGEYRYRRGWNIPASGATLLGCAVAWIGLAVPQLKGLFDYAWFVGFGVSSLAYWGWMRLSLRA
jgi:NCS1 family nucleobase:cation symporter-1